MTYLEGELENMSPSSRHEAIKTLLARLIEAWAEEHDVPLNGYGSTTYRDAAAARALEPDECYVVGGPKEVPDLAIEVVVTGGGIDKLAVYRGLGVPEVWFWVDGRIAIYQLGSGGYASSPRSALLPGLDPSDLAGTLAEADECEQTQAVKAFRARIRLRAQ
jgi:Uma2 family endonuclease